MLKWVVGFLGALAFLNPQLSWDGVEKVCSAFPPNQLSYPEFSGNRWVSPRVFNALLDRVEQVYRPIFQRAGHRFRVERRWTDGTVNAFATNEGFQRSVHMYGGMARHPLMTPDAFLLIACHEIGHHFGGAPVKANQWSSAEGQSDYYATLKCMRLVLAGIDHDQVLSHMAIDPVANRMCNAAHHNRNDVELCLRTSMAGLAVAKTMADFQNGAPSPRLDRPDSKQIAFTFMMHPMPQCRLDTYFQGALCNVAMTVPTSPTDFRVGTCDASGQLYGRRPRCWFNPSDPHLQGAGVDDMRPSPELEM